MKKNNFLEQLERSRQAAAQGEKPVGEMNEAELNREQERLEGELRQLKQEAVAAAREELAGSRSNRSRPLLQDLNRRSSRRPWK